MSASPPALASHSRFVQRIRRRYGAELALLGGGIPGPHAIAALVHTLKHGGRTLASALRVARQVVIERLAVADIESEAPLEAVMRCMTDLAETALELALAEARREADARHGRPQREDGSEIDFWIVGMGKLGARELNVSSDIDLIYIYEDDGQTVGERSVSAHEYFSLVAKRLYALIGEVTEDGFVFRVDLALRPHGNSGPPVLSLAMLEEYLLAQGREWERFAWLKGRVVAPRASVSSGRALALRALVTPFVYRKYLDYGVFESLRDIHRRIREEAQRRAAGRPERANDVKLSRGGIREIEFIVQLLLVVRGGQFPEIRSRSTLKCLDKLAAGGLMKVETALSLAEAYVFLRRVEHRIQFLDDQQTHVLPTADADLAWIADSLQLSPPQPAASRTASPAPQRCVGATCDLLDRLCAVRELVATEFDLLLHEGRSPVVRSGPTCIGCGPGPLPFDSPELLEHLPEGLRTRVKAFAASARALALREESKRRLGQLFGRAAADVASGACTRQAAERFVDWIEPLLRRESYLALLVERPRVQARLLRLLGLARWPMRYLMQHPGVIDELADERQIDDRFDSRAFIRDLDERHAAWQRSGDVDEGALLDTLRRAHHAEVFRTLVRDVEQRISTEQVADDLSALADAVLDCCLRWAWQHLRQRHRAEPQFAVIAYGKLGGLELGYGGDLDVVFLYDDSDEEDADNAQVVYAAFVRKLIGWLTLRTAVGELFDIDTALRPNGGSGLLVTSVSAFDRYQRGRGSNSAWAWEHQALTRARFCAGTASLAERFEATRRAVLAMPRDTEALRTEVRAMREKVRLAHPARGGLFDLKHGEGGMMDAEFAVQYLVLAESGPHPSLQDNAGNTALLERAERVGLLPPGVGAAAAAAYRNLRRAQHRARLDEEPTAFAPELFAAEREAIAAVWRAVFGA